MQDSLMASEFDILVVGGGPAGCAAALQARRSGAHVLLMERDKDPGERGYTAWLGPAGVELLKALKVNAKRVKATPFRGLHLYPWNFREHVFVDESGLAGWLVERPAFDVALREIAQSSGAEVRIGAAPKALSLAEDFVEVEFEGGAPVRGRVMLIADGTFSNTALQANLLPAGRSPEMTDCVCGGLEARTGDAGLHVAIGARRAGQLTTFVRDRKRTSVALATRDSESPPRQQFETVWSAAATAGLVPERPPDDLIEFRSPAGAALDMDTHVGKRCLLIGDAGGFVTAFSNEGFYPAMCSGCIAVDTALRALKSKVMQDELATFGGTWRQELADYLRMPNTDLSLLIPLVFQNEQMSRRVARAFLLGQQF
jgi:flavin-dependent dehydrogenase